MRFLGPWLYVGGAVLFLALWLLGLILWDAYESRIAAWWRARRNRSER